MQVLLAVVLVKCALIIVVSQSFLLAETFKYLYMLFSSDKDTKLQKAFSLSQYHLYLLF